MRVWRPTGFAAPAAPADGVPLSRLPTPWSAPQLAAVHLVDAHHCSDPAKIVSATLLSLHTMMRLELPHVNILSKIDIAERYGPLRET